MATYAIGDVQGCFAALERLLAKIEFNVRHDTLWSTGDLVNRGPQSLAVLRFCRGLGDRLKVVLGNHDLHLLAVACGAKAMHGGDTLQEILAAPDREELLAWLSQQPLLVWDAALGYVMTHAGLAPVWDLAEARRLAGEVEAVVRGADAVRFYRQMYGNQPDLWRDDLVGDARLRCIVNYFTRMRYCYADGRLDLTYKGDIEHKPKDLLPWYEVGGRRNREDKIIFGHWAALGGKVSVPNLYPLDTGCVWGRELTAMCLEDGRVVSVAAG